jgi:hypothetical protein
VAGWRFGFRFAASETALILASVGLERPTAEATLSEAFPLIGPEKFSGPIVGFPLPWILNEEAADPEGALSYCLH